MRILSAQEMAAADRRSVEAGVPVWHLMQHAGEAVARFCLAQFPAAGADRQAPVVAVCGKGNNGGDGLCAAARLAEHGRFVRVLLLGSAGDLKAEPAQAFERVHERSTRTAAAIDVCEAADEAALRAGLEGASLVLDAVVGTGFKPPLRGIAVAARDLLAGSGVPVVAVDLPSGWDADSTAQSATDEAGQPAAFRASSVVTFVAPKPAHVFGHLTPAHTFGPVVVAPIGTPPGAIGGEGGLRWAGASAKLFAAPRAINSNKGRYGHVLVLGGALGKAGAPSMASLAALRAGAGLVTAAVPAGVWPSVAAIAPELMLQPIGGADEASPWRAELMEAAARERLLKGISVVAAGPGMGQAPGTAGFVRALLQQVTLPLVLDADALNVLAGDTSVLKRASAGTEANGRRRTIVLTPHPGEMARLAGLTVPQVEADRVGLARRFATENGITLVLKGWRTLIAHPDGSVAVNTTGNPGMAKGGSGDILTGIVAAMLAQFPHDVAAAVEAAVYLHGLAGDFACLAADEHTLLATDTLAHLSAAFRQQPEDDAAFTWICGSAARRSLKR